MALIQWFLGTIAIISLLFLLPGCSEPKGEETTAEKPIIDWDLCIELSNHPIYRYRKNIFRCVFKNEVCYMNQYDYSFQCFKNSDN